MIARSRLPYRNLYETFGVPVIIAVVIAYGLLSALIGDGIWDVISWLALALPVVMIGYFWLLARGRK